MNTNYEDTLLDEIRRLEEENETLRATIGMVRIVLAKANSDNIVARVIESLGSV
jgi:hypothetical protein